MSADLTINLYFRDRPNDLVETFVGLAEAVAGWIRPGPEWQSFNVNVGPTMQRPRREKDFDRPKDLRRLAMAHAAPGVELSVSTPCGLGRIEGGEPERWVPLSVQAWGSSFLRHPTRDEVEGRAALWFRYMSPFYNASDEEDPGTEEDLESLTSLVHAVARRVEPDEIRVLTESFTVPLFSHFTWFRGPEQVLRDLRWLARVWTTGLPDHHDPPLSVFDEKSHGIYPEGMSREQRREIWEHLSAGIPHVDRVTEAHVRQLIDSNRFDVYRIGDGFSVLQYPYFVNGFVDRFYTDLLELAGAARA
jgi:hypothetical protein